MKNHSLLKTKWSLCYIIIHFIFVWNLMVIATEISLFPFGIASGPSSSANY